MKIIAALLSLVSSLPVLMPALTSLFTTIEALVAAAAGGGLNIAADEQVLADLTSAWSQIGPAWTVIKTAFTAPPTAPVTLQTVETDLNTALSEITQSWPAIKQFLVKMGVLTAAPAAPAAPVAAPVPAAPAASS